MKLVELGIIMVFVGVLLLFLGSFTQIKKGEQGAVRGAGGIFIGPFPLFGFASDKQMFYALIALVSVLTILFLIFGRLR